MLPTMPFDRLRANGINQNLLNYLKKLASLALFAAINTLPIENNSRLKPVLSEAEGPLLAL